MRKIYRLSDLPLKDVPFRELPIRGLLDGLVPTEQGVRVGGWMVLAGERMDALEVYLDGKKLGTRPVTSRPDVQKFYPWLPHGEGVGFDVEVPVAAGEVRRVDLICRQGERRIGRMFQLVRRAVDELPTAPIDNMYRVAHVKQAHSFKAGGLKSMGDFLEPLTRHGEIGKVRRMLDWGCGCGRMSMHFLSAADCPEYCGCDIDPDAVQWAQANLGAEGAGGGGGKFAVLGTMPPAPYPADHFDLIVSFSVFTHLTREVQQAWLAEMRRMLAPGGIFLATVHGQMAYGYTLGNLAATFPPEGIVDSALDRTLDGIAPKGYYRGTFQSQAYTQREFGKHFKVLEYIEQGAGMQDLVVLQKC